jgi:hypothetical protein
VLLPIQVYREGTDSTEWEDRSIVWDKPSRARKLSGRRVIYKVRWKGWEPMWDEWVAEVDICPQLIHIFHAEK